MPELPERAKMIDAARAAHRRREEARTLLDDEAGRPPHTGDVYRLGAATDSDVVWVLAVRDPLDGRFLAVPCDAGSQVGSADVAVRDAPEAAASVARCRFATWVDAETLGAGQRVAIMSETGAARIRERWNDLGDGREIGNSLQRDTDEDPDYEDWLNEVVAPARRALPPVVTAPVLPLRPGYRPYYLIAATVALALGGGLAGLQLLRLNDRVQSLEAANRGAEQRYLEKVQDLESERGELVAERSRLELEHQRELHRAGEESAQASEVARGLREQIARLDERLREVQRAAFVVNPVLAYLDPPRTTSRGRVQLVVGPGASHLVFVLPLLRQVPALRYRLEVRSAARDEIVWVNDQLTAEEPGELRVGLPAALLRPGVYMLRFSTVEEGEIRGLADIEVELFWE